VGAEPSILNWPEPTVLADSCLGYTGLMPEDPSSPSPSDTNPSPSSEPPNRPEPVVETPVSASESANTPPESVPQDQSLTPASPEQPPASSTQSPEAPLAPEPAQSQETPSEEPVSMSTSAQTEPSGTTLPAQAMPPESEPIKEENQGVQAATEPQSQPEPEAPQPQIQPPPTPEPVTPVQSPKPSIPSLHYPFFGSYPVAFDFAVQPTDERIKKKYQEWGIVAHNGIDFGLQEGTEILACDEGVVTQAGYNGDHGISVTIKHSWGTSVYSHLQSLGVLINDGVTKVQFIGASGQTGFTTGPHLHFGIQPNSPDTNNGYLGYINPAPYLTETSPLPQFPQSPLSPQSPEPPDLSSDLSAEPPSPPQSPQSTPPTPPNPSYPPVASPSADQEEIEKQAIAMFDARLKENSMKGNQSKKAKRDVAIQKIFTFAQEKKRITNEQVRDLLHISQSTASDYLSDLVNRGMLKVEGKGKATVYLF